jgi:hypothetical protein
MLFLIFTSNSLNEFFSSKIHALITAFQEVTQFLLSMFLSLVS